jgi:Rps23 Pro-64 3,4-dihydroxylase Tpa1-like proline 4-hydroxylase
MFEINVSADEYNNAKPFPHCVINNILPHDFAFACQKEILNIDASKWDRYQNPFENKYTLRDKNNMPENCSKLFDYLTSDFFVEQLSGIVGEKLLNDPTKNWWGIHKYDDGDYLDIHCDAGIHPITKQKKHVTLGLYLSTNWKEENGGHLELWEGTNVCDDNCEIIKCISKTLPSFNKLIIFTCNDYGWHGNPTPVNCKNGENRIFLTLSYVSEKHDNDFKNMRKKAFFVKRPEDPYDETKDKLRFIRADSEKCKDVYKLNSCK